MATKSGELTKSQREDLIKEAMTCFEDWSAREDKNWTRAKEAIKFRALEQWPDALKADRENPNQKGGARPCPVLDKTNQYVRQIVNELRMNRPAVKARPVDDKGDPKVAEVYQGIIRCIEDKSDADVQYTGAGENAVDGGFGYLRLRTEYCDDDSFDQDIKIEHVRNRFSVLLGPHKKPDGSDAQSAIIFEDMKRSDFEAKYPKAKAHSFDTNQHSDWYTKDTVRVAEYIKIKSTPRDIVLLDTGEVMELEEYEKQAAAAAEIGLMPPAIKQQRKSQKRTVCWYKLSATDVLEKGEIVGTCIPIVKIPGNEIITEQGESRTSGMIEAAMDPQRLHNYSAAKFIEGVALAPQSPWLAAAGQIEDRPEWQDANRVNYSVMTYNPIDVNNVVLPPPQRVPPAGVPAGWQQLMLNTEHGIEASVGMYGASIGGPSRERSGIALEGQKEQAQTNNYHFADNLARGIRRIGNILIEWIPLVMTRAKAQRILGEDGQAELIFLNPDQEVAYQEDQYPDGPMMGQPRKSYNLNVGKYDITITTGPSFLTKREEAFKIAMEMARNDPTLLQKAGDKIFRLADAHGMQDIADRLKLFLPPEVVAAESQESGDIDPRVAMLVKQVEERQAALSQAAQELAQKELQVKVLIEKVGADKAEVQSMQQQVAAEMRVFQAEVKAARAELKAQEAQLDADRAQLQADRTQPADGPQAAPGGQE